MRLNIKIHLASSMTSHRPNEQPACESVPISEKGDDGVTVESSLRVPQHLSLAFSAASHEYCSAAYAVAPHSLPARVQGRTFVHTVLTSGWQFNRQKNSFYKKIKSYRNHPNSL